MFWIDSGPSPSGALVCGETHEPRPDRRECRGGEHAQLPAGNRRAPRRAVHRYLHLVGSGGAARPRPRVAPGACARPPGPAAAGAGGAPPRPPPPPGAMNCTSEIVSASGNSTCTHMPACCGTADVHPVIVSAPSRLRRIVAGRHLPRRIRSARSTGSDARAPARSTSSSGRPWQRGRARRRGRHQRAGVAEAVADVRAIAAIQSSFCAHRHHHLRVGPVLQRPGQPVQQHLDDVVAMALHARRSGHRRRHHRARRRTGHRRPAAIRPVAAEAQLVVDRLAALEQFLLLGLEPRDWPRPRAGGVSRILPISWMPRALLRVHRRLDDRRRVRHLQHVDRQHRLERHVHVGVLGRRAVVVRQRAYRRVL